MSKILSTALVCSLFLLFAFNIKLISFYFWVFLWYIDSMFNVFSYLWASCVAIRSVIWWVSALLVFLLFMKLYDYLKS